jgi:hypothetical protein
VHQHAKLYVTVLPGVGILIKRLMEISPIQSGDFAAPGGNLLVDEKLLGAAGDLKFTFSLDELR